MDVADIFPEKKGYGSPAHDVQTTSSNVANARSEKSTTTYRVITRRQIQMYSIGGVIGTAVFVSIGSALTAGGPLFLLLAYSLWCSVIYCVNEGQAEMVCFLPIESSFSRFGARYVDLAFGRATAWNYFLVMVSLLCFEITAFDSVLAFWTDSLHPAIIPSAILASYAFIHLWSARFFAESEFWIVLGKITLMIGLFMFTLVTMCGGNPIHDAFGFRAWRDPGPTAEYISTGASGRLHGFLACVLSAAFAVAGPDMLSMIAGEATNPRKVMPTAFRTVFYRLIIFFVLSALAVGILVPSNDPVLLRAIENATPGAGRSPYVAAMTRLKIRGLPHVVNAGIATSIFSAGSAFFFNGARVLHGLALDTNMLKILRPVNRNGVPYTCCLVVLAFGCLSYLRVSSSANKVLNWFISISASSQLVTWAAMCWTYLRWRKACDAQGVDRGLLQYRSWCQPVAAWFGLVGSLFVTLINGYTVFLAGNWVTEDFIFAYFAPAFFVSVYVIVKLFGDSPFIRPESVDLYSGLGEIEAHEADLAEKEGDKRAAMEAGLLKRKAWTKHPAIEKVMAWLF